jgi:hypothetical protein
MQKHTLQHRVFENEERTQTAGLPAEEGHPEIHGQLSQYLRQASCKKDAEKENIPILE